MTLTHDTLPGTPWPLSAPESYALLHGPGAARGREAFKLALTELVTRGALRIQEAESRGALGRTSKHSLLVHGAKPSAPSEAVLQRVWEIYSSTPAKTVGTAHGVPIADFARAAQAKLGGLDAYLEREVFPALAQRGYVERSEKKKLFVFTQKSWAYTPRGEAAREDLQKMVELGNSQFSTWAQQDPARAAQFALLAGGALLLMPAAFPEMRLLRDQFAAGGVDTAGYYADSDDSNWDFGSFDNLDSAFDAIDSGVDTGGDSGGSGGSDSGGSD